MTPAPSRLAFLSRPLGFPRWARRPLAVAYGALMLFAAGSIAFLVARDVSPLVALAWIALAFASATCAPRVSRDAWRGLHLFATAITFLLAIAAESWFADRVGAKPTFRPISWFSLVWSLGGFYNLAPSLRRLWNAPAPTPPSEESAR